MEAALENRVFYDLEINVSIAYYQLFEGIPSRGLDPIVLTLTDCRDGLGCKQGGCTPGNCTSPTWSATERERAT